MLLKFWWFDWFKYITWIWIFYWFLFYGFNTFVAGQNVISTPPFFGKQIILTNGRGKEIKFCGNERLHNCGKVNAESNVFFIQKNNIKLRKCKAQTNIHQYADIPLIFVSYISVLIYYYVTLYLMDYDFWVQSGVWNSQDLKDANFYNNFIILEKKLC